MTFFRCFCHAHRIAIDGHGCGLRPYGVEADLVGERSVLISAGPLGDSQRACGIASPLFVGFAEKIARLIRKRNAIVLIEAAAAVARKGVEDALAWRSS